MSLIDQVRLAGVVGAGGGGFPAHVKLGSKAGIIIANGAECEPLLHKDAAVMEHYAPDVVRGVELCMAATGAEEGVIGIKAKKKKAVEAIEEACRGTRVRVQLDIPSSELKAVVKNTGARSRAEAVLTAVKDFNRRRRLVALADRLKGSLPNFMTLEDLKAMREDAKWEAAK